LPDERNVLKLGFQDTIGLLSQCFGRAESRASARSKDHEHVRLLVGGDKEYPSRPAFMRPGRPRSQRALTLAFLTAGLALAALAARTLAAGAGGRAHPAPPEWIWWEAERPRTTNFPSSNPFAPQNEAAVAALSGGTWLGADKPQAPLYLEYDVAVRNGGTYGFYARKFWRHGPFRWRFDDQPWRRCERDVALLDDVGLAKLVSVNWVGLGPVRLAAGRHVLRIEVDPDASAVAFDCFLLSEGPFTPRGKLKPGEKLGGAPPGWFAFEPDDDPFDASPIDLRWLNERAAGDQGFIEARGDVFVHGKSGQAVRFWGINLGHEILDQDGAAFDRLARRLAKLGVNMVRFHGPLWRDDDLRRVDEAKLKALHRLVAALKREGIYLSLSTYYPLWLRPTAQPGLEGFDGRLSPFGIAFFSPGFQQLQRGWWREALTAKNPHTGLTLLQDPTLALIEIQNEDSLFFWTFSPYESIPAPQMEILERAFGRWLAARYGNLDSAIDAWPGGGLFGRLIAKKVRGDEPASGRVGLMPLGELSRGGPRARDTAAFLADVQRRYYDETYAFLKKELGFRGAVTGSNWVTADPERLGPLDKWSNTGCDFLDHHGYFGGPHQGESAAYLISTGDRYDDASALLSIGEMGKPGKSAFDLPMLDPTFDGKPSTLSEINWPPPNRFRAEMPVLAAAYGALQGRDAILFFANDGVGWAERLGKFSISNPAAMGQFPATALAFRAGLIREGAVSRHLDAKLTSLFALEGAGIGSLDPLTYLTGRVEIDFSDSGRSPPAASPSAAALIDRGAKTVRSNTGELAWDYGRGLVRIDAPSAQGATGFLAKAGPIKLKNLTIDSQLEYGAILFVAMDGRPLASSRKMLLQVMTEDSNFGWSAPGQGLRPILDVGKPPLVVKRIAGTVAIDRPDAGALKVTALDWNGYPSPAQNPIRAAGRVTLLPSTFYYLIEK
jgi:hypothetical protein